MRILDKIVDVFRKKGKGTGSSEDNSVNLENQPQTTTSEISINELVEEGEVENVSN